MQRPVWRGNESKKTGARSVWARMCGQNPLYHIFVLGTLSVYVSQLRNAQAILFVLVIKLTKETRQRV